MDLYWLDSGGDENFMAYNSVPGVMKIDLFFVVMQHVFCFCKKIKINF